LAAYEKEGAVANSATRPSFSIFHYSLQQCCMSYWRWKRCKSSSRDGVKRI